MIEISKRKYFFVGLSISAATLGCAIYLTDMRHLWLKIIEFDKVLAFWGLALTFVHIAIRNARWVSIIDPPVSYANAMWAQGIGFIVTLYLPFRLGDVVRVMVLASLEKVTMWRSSITVILERIIDICALCIVCLSLLFFMPTNILTDVINFENKVPVILSVIAIGVVLVSVVWLSRRRFANTLAKLKTESANAIRFVCKPNVALRVMIWTIVGWIVGVARHWLILIAFVPDATWVQAAFLTVMLTLGVSIPSSPGFIGVFQLVGQQALVLPFPEAYDATTAFGIAVILHLCLIVTCTVYGIIGLAMSGERLGRETSIGAIYRRARLWQNKDI